MATLYLARRFDHPQKSYVIKKIVENLSTVPTYVELFRREAEISLGLKHPNLIKTFDVGTNNDGLFIVLEHIDGFNLKQILVSALQNDKKLSLEFIVFILTEISKGLSYLHQDGENQ